ncbi:helix-turn-helix transcriptional regulator [Flavobacteriaceae bacterium]|nr:helix-turn-helix transcriptional regulator [Flavobacteriaceae bacterium]
MEYQAITDRIFELISKLNMSQAQFAELTGIPRSTFSHLQSGRNKPSLDLLDKIIKALPEDTSITQLVYGQKDTTLPLTDSEKKITSSTQKIYGRIEEVLILKSDGSYEKFIKEVK